MGVPAGVLAGVLERVPGGEPEDARGVVPGDLPATPPEPLEPPLPPIALTITASTCLVFSLATARALRLLGIPGLLSGTLPQAPQQNTFFGLPLQLSLDDVHWLVANNHAYVTNPAALPPPDPVRAAVYAHLRAHHYMLNPGLRFGGDFLAYPGDPLRFHAHAIVHVAHGATPTTELARLGRLATAVKKTYVLAGGPPSAPRCFLVEWAGFG